MVAVGPIINQCTPSRLPLVPIMNPSAPIRIRSARAVTRPRPQASVWVQYKRRRATAVEATISLCFTAWNSAVSSLRETTCVEMALVGCWGDVKVLYSGKPVIILVRSLKTFGIKIFVIVLCNWKPYSGPARCAEGERRNGTHILPLSGTTRTPWNATIVHFHVCIRRHGWWDTLVTMQQLPKGCARISPRRWKTDLQPVIILCPRECLLWSYGVLGILQ